METMEFGVRLRELRKQAGLSQGELADKVGVNFTYLSKIENGVKSPPSEKVILRLAKVLDADSDELMTLAGRLPSDIVKMLKSRENLQFVRSGGTENKFRAANKKERFNIRLRELRKQAGMTQRQLADKVGVNFTYLSKIENGVLRRPSKSLIIKLGEVLNADKDELLILAGRVPSDITERLLKNRETLQLIRSTQTPKIFKASNKVRTGLQNLTRSVQNSTKGTGLFFKNHQGLARAAISVVTVLAIVGGLWFATPVMALNITVTNPASGTLGSTYSFTVRVDVENTDLLPITSVDLSIYNADSPSTYTASFTNLPLATGSKHYTSTETGGGTVSVSATTGAAWGYAADTRYGYGYGYQSGSWGTENFGYSWGYGYGYSDWGYGDYVGPTWITYTVSWVPPSTWPEGTYNIRVLVYGNGVSTAFTTTTIPSFTLSAAVVAPDEDDAAVVVRAPGVTSILVYWDGRVVFDVVAESVDGKATLDIPRDTIAKTAEDKPLRKISIIPMEDPPVPPVDASIVGLTYDLGPDGATFDPPITLTFTYDPDEIPEGVNEEDLVIAIWDEAAGEWIELVSVVDPVTNTITAEVSHFTAFAIIAAVPVEEEVEVAPPAPPVPPEPAAFTVSNLTVRPAEVQPKEAVTIIVSVANTGGTEGSYTVVLKLNGVKEAEKSVTIAAGSSEMVTFSVTTEEAGSYSVTVDGLSASFTVVAPPVEKPPVEKPPVEEVPVEKPPINWGLIGGIIAAVVVIGGLLAYFLWWRRRTA